MLELKFADVPVVIGNSDQPSENDLQISCDFTDQEDKTVVHFVFTDENAMQTFCFTTNVDEMIIALEAYKKLRLKE